MTLEGCVVKIADVIAYIGRDIEDAIRLKVIKRRDIPREVRIILGSSNDKIIDILVSDLIKNSYNKDYLAFSEDILKALNDLLNFNIKRIYLNPATNTQVHKIDEWNPYKVREILVHPEAHHKRTIYLYKTKEKDPKRRWAFWKH